MKKLNKETLNQIIGSSGFLPTKLLRKKGDDVILLADFSTEHIVMVEESGSTPAEIAFAGHIIFRQVSNCLKLSHGGDSNRSWLQT